MFKLFVQLVEYVFTVQWKQNKKTLFSRWLIVDSSFGTLLLSEFDKNCCDRLRCVRHTECMTSSIVDYQMKYDDRELLMNFGFIFWAFNLSLDFSNLLLNIFCSKFNLYSLVSETSIGLLSLTEWVDSFGPFL